MFARLAAAAMLVPLSPGASARPQETAGALAAVLRGRVEAFAHDSMRGRAIGTERLSRAAAYVANAARSLHMRGLDGASILMEEVPVTQARVADDNTSFVLSFPGFPVNRRPAATLKLDVDYQPLPGALGPWFSGQVDFQSRRIVFGGRLGTNELVHPDSVRRGDAIVFLPPVQPNGLPDGSTRAVREELRRYTRAGVVLLVNRHLLTPAQLSVEAVSPLSVPNGAVGRGNGSPFVIAVTPEIASLSLVTLVDAAPVGYAETTAYMPRAAIKFNGAAKRLNPAPRQVAVVLPGADPALRNELVVLTAPLDGAGMLPPSDAASTFDEAMRRDSVFNGADAGASGAMALLEIARRMSEAPNRPRRSVMFLWTVGADKNALGSRWFATRSRDATDRIVAAIHVDRIGRGGSVIRTIGSTEALNEFDASIKSANANAGFGFQVQRMGPASLSTPSACSGDHSTFASLGIPSIMLTGEMHRESGGLYDDPASLDYDGFARMARFVDALAVELAGRDTRFPRFDRTGLAAC